MKTRFLAAVAISLSFAAAIAPAASAFCGDDDHEAGRPVPADAATVTVKVQGMSCGGCAEAVRSALLKLDFVYDAVVDWQSGMAEIKVDGAKVDQTKLDDVIAKAGYKVERPGKG